MLPSLRAGSRYVDLYLFIHSWDTGSDNIDSSPSLGKSLRALTESSKAVLVLSLADLPDAPISTL